MEELVTVDLILNWLKDNVEHKRMIDAHTWVDACQKLNVLLSDEHDKLYDLQQKVAQEKVRLLDSIPKPAVNEAKLRVEATELYKAMKLQEAKIKRVEEAIRISKIQAKLKDNELRNY